MRRFEWRWNRWVAGIALLLAWWTCMFALWQLPSFRARPNWAYNRTCLGALRWAKVVHGGNVPISVTQLGGPSVARVRINPVTLPITVLLTVGVTGYCGLVAFRLNRELRPRSQCNHCGYVVRNGNRFRNHCPECGRLPNLTGNALKLWNRDPLA